MCFSENTTEGVLVYKFAHTYVHDTTGNPKWPFMVVWKYFYFHRMAVGWKWPLIIWSNPLLEREFLELVSQDHTQPAFEWVQGWRLHNLWGQPVPIVQSPPHCEKVFPDVQREPPVFLFVAIVPCPATVHHWKESGFLYTLPTDIYTDWRYSPVPLQMLSPGWTVQLSQPFLIGEIFQSIIFVDLYWTLSNLTVSLLYKGVCNWTQYSRWGFTSAE